MGSFLSVSVNPSDAAGLHKQHSRNGSEVMLEQHLMIAWRLSGDLSASSGAAGFCDIGIGPSAELISSAFRKRAGLG